MVQSTIGGFLGRLGAFFTDALALLPWVLVVLGVLSVFGLVLYTLRPKAFIWAILWLRQGLYNWAMWLPVAVVVFLVFFGLKIAQYAVGLRYVSQNNAQFSRLEDPPGRNTQQFEPIANYLEVKTYTRSIRIPPEVLKRLDGEGREAILPYVREYLAEPQSRNVRRVVDSILQNGKSLYFVREAQILEQRRLAILASDLAVRFEFGDTGLGRSFYRANFVGRYTFENPNNQPLDITFTFPFPNNSGALSDFSFEARGETAKEIVPDNNGFIWFATLKPKEKVIATIQYKNQGSDTWNYQFNGRNVVNQFKLEVNSPRTVKFLRGSLYPSTIGSSLVWQFPKIVTSQGVVLSFPETSLRETLSKTYVFMPFAILLALVWVLVYGWHNNLPVKSMPLSLAVLGLGLGLSASAVTMGYTDPTLALWLGSLLAAVLGILALGLPFALPVVVSSFSPLVFLSGGNAGLWLLAVALLMLGSLLTKYSLGQILKWLRRG
jgi:hypothetical protein